MNPREAAVLLARLQGVWPRLAADVADDWLRIVQRAEWHTGQAAVTELIDTRGAHAPMPTPADFQGACRHIIGPAVFKALPAPAPDATERERVAGIISETRTVLERSRKRKPAQYRLGSMALQCEHRIVRDGECILCREAVPDVG